MVFTILLLSCNLWAQQQRDAQGKHSQVARGRNHDIEAQQQRAAQVIHSISGFGEVEAPDGQSFWGSFLFFAVQRADGSVSGRAEYVHHMPDVNNPGEEITFTTFGEVTNMRVIGNMATVFAELPEGFDCPVCGPIHPTHLFFVMVEGSCQKPDQVGYPLWFGHWEEPGKVWTVQELMAMTPKQFIEWEAHWGFFNPPLLDLDGKVLVR
jgi:hypothetical protein